MATLAVVVVLVLGLAVLVRALAGPADQQADGSPQSGGGTGPVPAGAEPGRVSAHVDGDTVRLSGESGGSLLPADGDVAVRLLEIDAPEVDGPYRGAECFGEEASAALVEALPVGSPVWVTRDTELYDPYDRMLLYLWDESGALVNLEMVRRGYAEAVLFEPNDEHIDDVRRAESEARAAGRGLWGACG